MITAGIDYSMTSPAICIAVSDTEFNVHYLCKQKKLHKATVIEGNNVTLCLNGGPSFMEEDSMFRYDSIGEWAIECLNLYGRPDRIVIEDYAFAAKGRVFHIGENTGILKHKMWVAGFEWNTCEPTRLKAFAGAGKRSKNGSKDLMEQKFMEQTGIDIRTEFGLGEKTVNPISDIIDAYWLAMFGRWHEIPS